METPTKDWQAIASAQKAAATLIINAFASAHGLAAAFAGPAPDCFETEQRNVHEISLRGILSDRDLEITDNEDVGALLDKLAKGELSAVEVTAAYCRRAVIAHRLTNCLTETFFDQAFARTQDLDNHFKRTGKPVGALHGLPISLKDHIDVEGVKLNMGYVGWVGRISKKNAALVDILLAAGAVLYCKTNVPQSLMAGETYNHVYGRTVNPRNASLTCGGSSGGEGALVAMRGSPLGVGSDIGGSIRTPAGFNGLYGLRPSYNRVPYQGCTGSMAGFETVPVVIGPISSSVNGLKPFFKAVLDGEPWRLDPLVIYRPWDDDLYRLKSYGGGEKLCFGLFRDDGLCRPAPPYQRALDMTKKAIEAAGHSVVEWSFSDTQTGLDILSKLFVADGGQDIDATCALSGEPRIYNLVDDMKPKELSVSKYWDLCARRRAYVKLQLDRWEATKEMTGTGRPIDALIAPVSAHLPEPHNTDIWIWYTGSASLMDLPVGVFPVTQVDPLLDPPPPTPRSYRSKREQLIHESYDPARYRNAPVGLQCMGRKGQEEAVIRMTEIVDAALRKISF